MATDVAANLRKLIDEMRDRCGVSAGAEGPVRFVREYLGAVPDPWQEKVLRSYGAGQRRISIRSCHGPGKSAVLAWLALHQMFLRFPQTTLLTAPSAPQLFDVLWKELGKWFSKLHPALREIVEFKAESAVHRGAPAESFITARTARSEQSEAMQGVHRDDGYVLIIVDEASGVDEAIYEALAGSMSGVNVTTILASNPVRTAGLFYETHHQLAAQWDTHHVAKSDSPRVTDDYEQQIIDQYGKESNAYRVRVLGEFPVAGNDAVIPFELVEGAMGRNIEVPPDTPTVWGLDVARFGDDRTALCKRRGAILPEPIMTWSGLDLMQTVGRVKAEWDTTPASQRPVEILVDVIGVGAGVCDRLHQMGLPAFGVNVSETPAIGDSFHRLRDELWFAGKQWLAQRNVSMPRDEGLLKELTAPTYGYVPGTLKMIVESKEKMKKRLPRIGSPDKADALLLTLASTAVTAIGQGRTASWGQPLERELLGVEA